MPSGGESEERSLFEWATAKRSSSPHGYFIAGTIRGRPIFVGGNSDREVLESLVASACSGDSFILSCTPDRVPDGVTDSLVRGQIAGVTVGGRHPMGGPSGFLEELRRLEIPVTYSDMAEEFWRLNEAHAFAALAGRPLVVAKMATSIDGRIATRTGQSQWITGPEARARGHKLRRASGAILVGRNTVVADNPTLTARVAASPGGATPIRVVVTTRPSLPEGSNLRDVRDAPTIVYHGVSDPCSEEQLRSDGVSTCHCPGGEGRVDLRAVLTDLFRRGVEQVLVEGGGELIGSLTDMRLVDRLVHFRAPVLIGGVDARPCIGGRGIAELGEGRRGWRTTVRMVGDDVELTTDFALELRAPTCE